MTKKGKKRLRDILIAISIIVVASVLASLLTTIFSDIRDLPEVTALEEYEHDYCKPELIFDKDFASFDVNLRNIGDDGMLWIKTSSDELLFKKDQEFQNNIFREVLVGSKENKKFELIIKLTSNETKRLKINVQYGCYKKVFGMKFNCKEGKYSCSYDQKYPGNYDLIIY